MTRRCSHCSNNGHNSRTCPARGGGVRLFGVRLAEGVAAMKKSASMGCLPSSSTSAAACAASSSPAAGAAASPCGDPLVDHHHSASAASGYASDDPARASCSSNCRSERKKGPPFSPFKVTSIHGRRIGLSCFSLMISIRSIYSLSPFIYFVQKDGFFHRCALGIVFLCLVFLMICVGFL